jgi:hypothetical protein
LQACPQPPQLLLSVCVFVHVLPQSVVPPPHAQLPPEHVSPPVHAMPQPPQLLLLVSVSISQPSLAWWLQSA